MRIEPKKIMCTIDFSEFSDNTLSYGKLLASEFNSKLYLCHIVPDSIYVSGHLSSYVDYLGLETEFIKNARARLEAMSDKMDLEYEIIVSSGHPATQIDTIAREKNIDMVIAATHGGSGMKRFLIGSVTDRLVKLLNCPLLVLHPQAKESAVLDEDKVKIKKILVGCDFSMDSELAFEYALSLAQEFQTQLHLAHVVRPEDQLHFSNTEIIHRQENYASTWDRLLYPNLEKRYTSENLQKKQTEYQDLEARMIDMVPRECQSWCTPITALLIGEPYKELVEYANLQEIDMIVLGIRGHSLLEKFLVGSTTDRVISRASCPVLAVRHTRTPN